MISQYEKNPGIKVGAVHHAIIAFEGIKSTSVPKYDSLLYIFVLETTP